MRTFGNLIWFFVCGFWQWISWSLVGILWCVTIVGIPVGLQCFKFAGFVLWPFGKQIVWGGGAGSFLLNLVWIVFGGLELALASILNGLLLCITIVGIPFGLQCFKFAQLALMPMGARVVPDSVYARGY